MDISETNNILKGEKTRKGLFYTSNKYIRVSFSQTYSDTKIIF